MTSAEDRVAGARAELEEALDAIEDKLNVPKRFSELSAKAKTSYATNPIPWVIGATAAAIVVAGLVAWAVMSDDD
ncbi:MAG: DUF3618 domain-containing protein [Salinibacterium sp.]|nr:MAG: DUF3618 domain-containing protein [Salinibacterium sp.]